MNCGNSIDAAILSDYWLGLLPESEEEAVEEHLFGCDACGARLREVIALVDRVQALAREGDLQIVVNDDYLKRAAQDGLHIREYTVPRGGRVECTVTAEDDLLVGRLVADLGGAQRVDLSLCDENGVEQMRLPDIPVYAGIPSVILQVAITPMKAAPDFKLVARLMGVDETGQERALGDYTFDHTRTMPGPAGQ